MNELVDIIASLYRCSKNRHNARILLSSLSKYRKCDLAISPTTPLEVLHMLAEDNEEDILWHLATNHAITATICELIMTSGNNLRSLENMAANRRTPAEVLRKLSTNTNNFIRRLISSNTSATADLLQILAKDSSTVVREGVALNPSTAVSILEKLSKDMNVDVRLSVAKNRSTSVAILEKLSTDESHHVRYSIASNPSTLAEILKNIYEQV